MCTMNCLMFLVVLGFTYASPPVHPGFKTRITSAGLNYANNVAITLLSKSVMDVQIPNQSGSASHVTYQLTGLKINQFVTPASQMILQPPGGLLWKGNVAVIALQGNWAYQFQESFIKFSDSGTFDASAGGLSFSVGLTITMDDNGRPQIKAGGCSFSVGSVSVTFHGGESWIYNIFSGQMDGLIRSAIIDKMCGVITDLINNDGKNALSKLQVTVDIGDNFVLDYRLDKQPVFQKTVMETFHKGEIFWKSTASELPFSAPPLPPWNDTSRMLYLWVSDYLMSSLVYRAQKHNFLQYNLTAQDLPPANRSALNTTCHTLLCIGNLIPQLQKAYPNCQVDLHMKSSAVPNITISKGNINARAEGLIDFYARPVVDRFYLKRPDQYGIKNNLAYLFTLAVNMTAVGEVHVKNETLCGKLRDIHFSVHLVKTTITGINDKALQFIIDIALNTFVTPTINGWAAKGIPLPTIENMHFINSEIKLMERTLLIATDISYTPKWLEKSNERNWNQIRVDRL